MTGVVCKYLTAPEVVWIPREGIGRGWATVALPERSLCAWATYHPDAPAKLMNTPSWLLRNVSAGHLVKPETDCARCPCFTRGEPVE